MIKFSCHLSNIFIPFFLSHCEQAEVPRQKHQTQPIYTAPRLSDRFDRVSPLNSRRTTTDNYHDNNKSTSSRGYGKSYSTVNDDSDSKFNKNHRRHSTNTYTSSLTNNLSHKELSPTSSLGTNGQHFYEKSIKGSDTMIASGNSSSSNNSGSSNQKYNSKKMSKRKKIQTTPHFDSSSGSSPNSGNNSVNKQQSQNNNSNPTNNSQNHMGKALKISGASSR